jgi:hypothetical protein
MKKIWITLTEASEILKCSVQNVSLLVRNDKWKINNISNKKGRIVAVDENDIRKYKEEAKKGRPTKKR